MMTADHDVPTAAARRAQRALRLRIGVSLGAIFVLMLWILGAFQRDVIQPGRQPIAAEAATGLATRTLTRQSISSSIEAVGTVQPEQIATVSARVVANVVEIRVAAGQRVKSGAALVVLDDRDLRHRLEQAQDSVRSAEATLAQAQSDYARDKPLFDQQVITAYDFEHTGTTLKTAEANLHRLQQAEREADVNLSYTVIRSPFDGVVVDKLANEGDMAAPGKPLLTMYEQGRLWLEANVPENLMSRIHVGQPLSYQIDALSHHTAGRVVQIVPASDPSSRTVIVRVHLAIVTDVLPGMFGRLLIPAEPEPILAVPATALVRAGQLTMVNVVRDNRIERRTVQLGRTLGDQLEVLSGLTPGDTVVVNVEGGRSAHQEDGR